MAVGKVEGDELKTLVMLGKKRTLNFAFCPGPKNEHTILIDRKIKPDVLGRVARKQGAGNKVASGSFVLNSKTMELTCEEPLPAMARILRKYLKSQKVQVKVLILDLAGNVLDGDGQDEAGAEGDPPGDTTREQSGDGPQDRAGDTEEPAARADRGDPQPDAGGLARRMKAIQPILAAATGSAAETLQKAAALIVARIRAGDLAGAEKMLESLEGAAGKLEQAAGQPPTAPAADPPEQAPQAPESKVDEPRNPVPQALADRARALRDQVGAISGPAGEKLTRALARAAGLIRAGDRDGAEDMLERIARGIERTGNRKTVVQMSEADKWEAARDRLQPEIDRLMQEKRGDLGAINLLFNYAVEQAGAGNLDKALAAVARVAGLVRQAGQQASTAATREAQGATPDNVVAYARTRLGWIATRAGLRRDLEALKSAIDTATAGIEGLEDVPARSTGLFDYLDGIDSSLEDILEQLVETSDGDRRESLKSAARGIIEDYRSVLDGDFFQAVENNGFASTSMRADALDSLQKVSAALAA